MKKGLTALALVFGLIVTMPFLSKAAEILYLGKPCSLTVTSNNPEELPEEDLTKANIVIDLYKVADAVSAGEDVDGYNFELCPPFEELELRNNMKAAEWRAVSQQAAKMVLGENAVNGTKPVQEGIALDTPIEELRSGLYLMVARGQDLESYVDTNAEGDIITKAVTNGYTYTFRPELVALPSRAADEDGWLYDLTVVLKMEWEEKDQYGAIRIMKTLEGYNGDQGPAICVFDVEAVLDGKNVYSNVVTMVFDQAGDQKLLVEGIPAGAKVTVTEVYSGASYTLVTDPAKTVTIDTVQDIPEVSFRNRRDDRPNSGHGITNHFTYGEDGWKLDQVYDKTQG